MFQTKAYTGNSESVVKDFTLFLFAEFKFQNMNYKFCTGLFET